MLGLPNCACRGAAAVASVAVALLIGACGSKSNDSAATTASIATTPATATVPATATTTVSATATVPATATTTAPKTDGLGRSAFSLAVGKLCPPFYGQTNALAKQLAAIPITPKTAAAERQRAAGLLSQVQQRSEKFAVDLAAVARPVEQGARTEATKLITSLTVFAGYQRAEADLRRKSVLKPGTTANTRIPKVDQLDKLLAAENTRLKLLFAALDIPECSG